MISHDLHIVMGKTDTVICLNGHVCCSGTPQAVTESPAYRAMIAEIEQRAHDGGAESAGEAQYDYLHGEDCMGCGVVSAEGPENVGTRQRGDGVPHNRKTEEEAPSCMRFVPRM